MFGREAANPKPSPSFVHGNIIYGADLFDPHALYRLPVESYPGLSVNRKMEVLEGFQAFIQATDADFKVIRIARPWSVKEYISAAWQTFDRRNGSVEELERRKQEFRHILGTHVSTMKGRSIVRPEVFLSVRLRSTQKGMSDWLGDANSEGFINSFKDRFGINSARVLPQHRIADVQKLEHRLFERAQDYLRPERARASEVAWLIRHNYTRSLKEPSLDQSFSPQVMEVYDDHGMPIGFEPYSWDMMRLHEDFSVKICRRHLEIESEEGTSFQTFLVTGALPDTVEFPGHEAELMFTPTNLEFPVDAFLCSEAVHNRDAQKLARKKKMDADNQWKEEALSPHGPSSETDKRPHDARELEERLNEPDQPPLFRTSMCFAISSKVGEEELEDRVERVRASLGARVALHRPLGSMHELFKVGIPSEPFPLKAYKEHLVPEQIAATVPTACDFAGSRVGPYIGYTLSQARQPIRFDLGEAPQTDRPPTILMVGSLGSGKTIAQQLLSYHAFAQGSGPIVDIDPKGDPDDPDHRLHLLPQVAGEVEQIVLSSDPKYRGLIDPLRIAPPEIRSDVAMGFVLDILPAPVDPNWRTEIQAAINEVCADPDPEADHTMGEVVEALDRAGNEAARDAARALRIQSEAGLTHLAFAPVGQPAPKVGTKRIISIYIKNLTLPEDHGSKRDLTPDEQKGAALLRLVAIYALRLTTADRKRHSVFAMDEAWVLTQDPAGRKLLGRLSRLGRSQNVTPILASQQMSDSKDLEKLVGAFFAFGMESDEDAREALKLMGLDPSDDGLARRLTSYKRGRCFFMDYQGQVARMQVDLADDDLLAQLNTRPEDTRFSESEEDEGDFDSYEEADLAVSGEAG